MMFPEVWFILGLVSIGLCCFLIFVGMGIMSFLTRIQGLSIGGNDCKQCEYNELWSFVSEEEKDRVIKKVRMLNESVVGSVGVGFLVCFGSVFLVVPLWGKDFSAFNIGQPCFDMETT